MIKVVADGDACVDPVSSALICPTINSILDFVEAIRQENTSLKEYTQELE